METKTASQQKAHFPNRLGVKGWAWAGKYTWERYLYTMHRVTGLALLFYLGMHLIVNGSRLWGADSWTDVMDAFGSDTFKVGEYLVVAAFIVHGLNGIRLIIQHLGLALGKPAPPIFPYVDSLRRHRLIAWGVVVLSLGGLIYALIEFADKIGD